LKRSLARPYGIWHNHRTNSVSSSKLTYEKVLVFLIIGLLLFNCSSDEDTGIDCALFDPAFPSLHIKLVDTNGNNLIENGTVDPNEIILQNGLGFRFNPPNEFAVPDADIRMFDNTINLGIPNASTFEYLIQISDTGVITLDFSAELTRIPCDVTYFVPNRVVFDNQPLELREVFPLDFLIELELE